MKILIDGHNLGLKEPTGVEDIRRMAGMIEWLAKYIPRLAKLMEPLNKLRRKGVPWTWGDTEKLAFKNIKERYQKQKLSNTLIPASHFI